MKHYLIKFYTDFVNDFLTMEKYAEYHGLEVDEAEIMFLTGQKYYRML